jgi:hypothetical protein
VTGCLFVVTGADMANQWERFVWLALDAPDTIVERAPLVIQVAWLEDTQLRLWEPAAREPLKRGDDAALRTYLRDAAECPWDPATDPSLVREFLLSRAVDCAFRDELAEHAGCVVDEELDTDFIAETMALSEELVRADDKKLPLETQDLDPASFDLLRAELALPAASAREVLRAGAHWAITRWPPREQWLPPCSRADAPATTALAATGGIPSEAQATPEPMCTETTVSDATCALPSGVYAQLQRIGRQLHNEELLYTQHLLNAALERAQTMTANPRTEARLGRVGH